MRFISLVFLFFAALPAFGNEMNLPNIEMTGGLYSYKFYWDQSVCLKKNPVTQKCSCPAGSQEVEVFQITQKDSHDWDWQHYLVACFSEKRQVPK